jgi:hypothetical protein
MCCAENVVKERIWAPARRGLGVRPRTKCLTEDVLESSPHDCETVKERAGAGLIANE